MFRNLFLLLFFSTLFGNISAMTLIASNKNHVVSEFKILASTKGSSTTEKMYTKEYFDNGILKAEGWSIMNAKTDYWKFYNPNGTVSSEGRFSKNKKEGYWYYYNEEGKRTNEGHYKMGIALDWWIFYDIATGNQSKFQYQNNKKNGFALRYKNGKLTTAEKYKDDIKMGEWTSIWAFRRDNPDASF